MSNHGLAISVDAGTWLSVDPRGSGWSVYRCPAGGPSGLADFSLFVRLGHLGQGGQGREPNPPIVVREVLLSLPDGSIGGRLLRDLPLTKIEAAANRPVFYRAVLDLVLAEHVGMIPFPWSSGPDADSSWWFAEPEKPRAPRLKLRVPAGRGRPDEFYQAVAERFAYLQTVSQSPARDLAAANDVEVTTVHGWVKEARRRGLLASGERSRGKSGGTP